MLLAILSAAYAVYHGPDGLRGIAGRIQGLAQLFGACPRQPGYVQENELYFDTLRIAAAGLTGRVRELTLARRVNLRYYPCGDRSGVAFHENSTLEDVEILVRIFAGAKGLIWLCEAMIAIREEIREV